MNSTDAQVAYFKWLAVAHPDLYRRVAPTLSKGGQLGSLGWIQALVNVIGQVGSAVLQKKAGDKAAKTQAKSDATAVQLALLQTNTQRAAIGQPPVDINGNVINTGKLPVPQALAPYVAPGSSQIPQTLLPGVPNAVVYVGGALLVGLILRQLKIL